MWFKTRPSSGLLAHWAHSGVRITRYQMLCRIAVHQDIARNSNEAGGNTQAIEGMVNYNRVPNVIAGGGGGYLRPGRYVHYPQSLSGVVNDPIGPAHERLYVNVMHAIGMTNRSSFGLEQVEIDGTMISLRDPLPRLT